MNAIEWAWVVLGVFFVLQGASAAWIIRSVLRLRRTMHRVANHLQALSGALQLKGIVPFDFDEKPNDATKR